MTNVIAIVLLVGLVAGVYFFMQKKKKATSTWDNRTAVNDPNVSGGGGVDPINRQGNEP